MASVRRKVDLPLPPAPNTSRLPSASRSIANGRRRCRDGSSSRPTVATAARSAGSRAGSGRAGGGGGARGVGRGQRREGEDGVEGVEPRGAGLGQAELLHGLARSRDQPL